MSSRLLTFAADRRLSVGRDAAAAQPSPPVRTRPSNAAISHPASVRVRPRGCGGLGQAGRSAGRAHARRGDPEADRDLEEDDLALAADDGQAFDADAAEAGPPA